MIGSFVVDCELQVGLASELSYEMQELVCESRKLNSTEEKIKFYIQDSFSKCDQPFSELYDLR